MSVDSSSTPGLSEVLELLRTPLPAGAGLREVADRLALVRRARGWLDGVEAGLVQSYDTLRRTPTAHAGGADEASDESGDVRATGGPPPVAGVRNIVDEVAVVQRSSTTHAAKARRRGHLLDELPTLSAVLSAGEASGEHVDAVAGALSGLPASVRGEVVASHADEIAGWAAETDPNELSALVRALGDRVAGDAGASRRERQRRDARARMWIDRHTQMSRLWASWDPATGVRIQQRVDRTIETLFHDAIPDEAPEDPGERQDYLRACAVAQLILSPDALPGRAGGEIVVIIDAESLRTGQEHHDTLIDVPGSVDPTEITVGDVREWLGEPGCVVVPTVVGADGVVTTVGAGIPARAALIPVGLGGQLTWDRQRLERSIRRAAPLDLGRSTRLASHAQRIALRVMYPTCGIPGCSTRFEHCAPHHVRWWHRDHGTTDLDSLYPLCGGHHADVHGKEWSIALGPSRRVTVTVPGVGVLDGPPPCAHHDALRRRRRAARAGAHDRDGEPP